MHPRQPTRRAFLKTSAGLAAAGAVPYFLTSACAKEESKNDRLTIGSIGVGGRGSDIGNQASSMGNTVACCDVHAGNAQRFAEGIAKSRGKKPEIYGDYRKLLERKDVEAVTIGTPDHWHVKVAIDAMKAGKDVYCEKPLTLTMEESQLICKAVQQTGKVFQVGTQQRSEGDYFDKKSNLKHSFVFLRAIVLARSGRLGSKLTATSSVGGATTGGPFKTMAPPQELNWDFWLGQAPKVDFAPERIGWNFRWWFDYSGGQVTDWGVHHTDIAVWALGGEKTGVVEAEGKGEYTLGRETMCDYLLGKKKVSELPVSYNVAHQFNCKLGLPNGNTINLTSGPNELIIEGEKGKIRVNRGSLTGKPIEQLTKAENEWLDREVRKLYGGKEPGSHMRNFFECVKDRSLPVSDVFTHCNSVNACHMANIAMLLGRKITFDPKAYQFVGDDEATALMKRTQRAPYRITV